MKVYLKKFWRQMFAQYVEIIYIIWVMTSTMRKNQLWMKRLMRYHAIMFFTTLAYEVGL